jgi:hypothetical protein
MITNELIVGQILNTSESLFIDALTSRVMVRHLHKDTEIFIPIGIIEDWTWFEASNQKFPVDEIVYLGKDKFGVKQLVKPIDEFNVLSDDAKEDIIYAYTALMQESKELEDKLNKLQEKEQEFS